MARGGTWSKHPKQGQKPRAKLTKKEIKRLTVEFNEKQDYLRSELEEVTPYEYYRELFPEGSFEVAGSTDGERRPNGLASVLIDQHQKGRKYNRIIFDDLSMIEELNNTAEFVIIPPIGFSGRRRLSKLAYSFYGMCIDLDDVGVDNISDLLYQMQNKLIPHATYVVNSGTGLHVVYMFDEPIPAFPQYFESMGKLKECLSDMIWNHYTSREKNKQHQGIFQGYRAVGSQTKISEECKVTAYRCGKKVSMSYLNEFVAPEDQCIFDDLKYVSLEEAKEKWGDWYQRRIVEGRPVGDYKLSEKERERRKAWYETWKKRMMKGAFDGNRYYCMCILFNYAMKAEIDPDDALEDALELLPYMNELTRKENNEFTEDDVYSAMMYYDRKYIKMGRHGIKKMTKIDIGETKRNDRKQAEHLGRARAVQNFDDPGGSWRNKDGAPTKQEIVKAWREVHPGGKKVDCIRDTGLSKPTVYKWWDGQPKCTTSKPVKVQETPKPARVANENQEYDLSQEIAKMLLRMSDEERAAFLKFAEQFPEDEEKLEEIFGEKK